MKLFNGIDRLDNSKGYIDNNMVTCCKQCNYAKGQMTAVEYAKFVERVYNFQHTYNESRWGQEIGFNNPK